MYKYSYKYFNVIDCYDSNHVSHRLSRQSTDKIHDEPSQPLFAILDEILHPSETFYL